MIRIMGNKRIERSQREEVNGGRGRNAFGAVIAKGGTTAPTKQTI